MQRPGSESASQRRGAVEAVGHEARGAAPARVRAGRARHAACLPVPALNLRAPSQRGHRAGQRGAAEPGAREPRHDALRPLPRRGLARSRSAHTHARTHTACMPREPAPRTLCQAAKTAEAALVTAKRTAARLFARLSERLRVQDLHARRVCGPQDRTTAAHGDAAHSRSHLRQQRAAPERRGGQHVQAVRQLAASQRTPPAGDRAHRSADAAARHPDRSARTVGSPFAARAAGTGSPRIPAAATSIRKTIAGARRTHLSTRSLQLHQQTPAAHDGSAQHALAQAGKRSGGVPVLNARAEQLAALRVCRSIFPVHARGATQHLQRAPCAGLIRPANHRRNGCPPCSAAAVESQPALRPRDGASTRRPARAPASTEQRRHAASRPRRKCTTPGKRRPRTLAVRVHPRVPAECLAKTPSGATRRTRRAAVLAPSERGCTHAHDDADRVRTRIEQHARTTVEIELICAECSRPHLRQARSVLMAECQREASS